MTKLEELDLIKFSASYFKRKEKQAKENKSVQLECGITNNSNNTNIKTRIYNSYNGFLILFSNTSSILMKHM